MAVVRTWSSGSKSTAPATDTDNAVRPRFPKIARGTASLVPYELLPKLNVFRDGIGAPEYAVFEVLSYIEADPLDRVAVAANQEIEENRRERRRQGDGVLDADTLACG